MPRQADYAAVALSPMEPSGTCLWDRFGSRCNRVGLRRVRVHQVLPHGPARLRGAGAPPLVLLALINLLTCGTVGVAGDAVQHPRPWGEIERKVGRLSAQPVEQTSASVLDAYNPHRPLKTALNLRQGWVLVEEDAAGLWTALDYLYPAYAVNRGTRGARARLRATQWRETGQRQTGIYGPVKLLPDAVVPNVVRACCADAVCLRRVAWDLDAGTFLGFAGRGPLEGDAAVPCSGACSMFVSFARQVVKLERAPRRAVPGLARWPPRRWTSCARSSPRPRRERWARRAKASVRTVFGPPTFRRRVDVLAVRRRRARARRERGAST
jgi:hypothetical protein